MVFDIISDIKINPQLTDNKQPVSYRLTNQTSNIQFHI